MESYEEKKKNINLRVWKKEFEEVFQDEVKKDGEVKNNEEQEWDEWILQRGFFLWFLLFYLYSLFFQDLKNKCFFFIQFDIFFLISSKEYFSWNFDKKILNSTEEIGEEFLW